VKTPTDRRQDAPDVCAGMTTVFAGPVEPIAISSSGSARTDPSRPVRPGTIDRPLQERQCLHERRGCYTA